jgi:hypothetical protein
MLMKPKRWFRRDRRPGRDRGDRRFAESGRARLGLIDVIVGDSMLDNRSFATEIFAF